MRVSSLREFSFLYITWVGNEDKSGGSGWVWPRGSSALS